MPTPTATRPASVPLDDAAAARLRTIIGRLSRRLRATASSTEAGLTPTRSSLLLTIDRRGPLRLAEIALSEGLNPTLLSRSITHLVESGLVSRTCDDGDRRAAWVQATPAGHALAERMREERTRALNVALAALPASDRHTVREAIPALERLAESLAGGRG